MELVDVLRDESLEPVLALPGGQRQVRRVGQGGRPARPANEVPGVQVQQAGHTPKHKIETKLEQTTF